MTKYLKERSLARRVLKNACVLLPPIPIEKIVNEFGITVRYEPLDSTKEKISGMLYRSKSDCVIGINSSESAERQRFTMGHELGHFLLHKGMQMHLDSSRNIFLRKLGSSKSFDPKELQANAFAAELLMPESFVKSAVNTFTKHIDDVESLIEELAVRFRVSSQAMTMRLIELGLVPNET